MRGGPGSKNAAARGGVAQAGTVAKEVHHKAAGGGGRQQRHGSEGEVRREATGGLGGPGSESAAARGGTA